MLGVPESPKILYAQAIGKNPVGTFTVPCWANPHRVVQNRQAAEGVQLIGCIMMVAVLLPVTNITLMTAFAVLSALSRNALMRSPADVENVGRSESSGSWWLPAIFNFAGLRMVSVHGYRPL